MSSEDERRDLHAALLEVRAAARGEPLDAVQAALGELLHALGEHKRAEDIEFADIVPE